MTGHDGYCRGGEHYIGENDTCWRCDLAEQREAKRNVFRAARKANALKSVVE